MNGSGTERDTVVNLLQLTPKRNLEFEIRDEELVTILVPKFQNSFLKKWVTPQLKKQFFRIKLDAYGSFVWNLCDGSMTVSQMSELMNDKFGNDVDPDYGRIQRFVQMFLKDKFLAIPDSAAANK